MSDIRPAEAKPVEKEVHWFPAWLRLTFTAFAGGVIAATLTSYVNVRLQTRTAVESDFTQFKSTSADLFQILSEYSKQATGVKPVSADIQIKLNNDMLMLFKVGDSIASRKPALRPDFDEYERRLFQLKQAAEELKGPADGKKFVEATAFYLDAEQQFKEKINSQQNGYFSLL